MNVGILAAEGDFVTFLGSDDLSHPRRIERQMGPLLANEHLIATTSAGIRVLLDGSITYFGFTPNRMIMSSLLFRTEVVRKFLGRFDDVRKGADAEFIARMELAFNPESVEHLPEVLGLVQLTNDSLSRADFCFGWMAGARSAYKHQYRGAHSSEKWKAEPGWRLSDERPSIARAPAGMLGKRAAGKLDVAVLSDWHAIMEEAENWTEMLSGFAARENTPVGLVSGIRPRFSSLTRGPVTQKLWEEVEAGRAAWTSWADRTEIDTLIVTDAEYLTYLPAANEIGLQVRKVLLALEGTSRKRRANVLPPIAWCETRVREVFGVDPTWLVSSPLLAREMRTRSAQVELGTLRKSPVASSSANSKCRPSTKRGVIGIPLPVPQDSQLWDLADLQTLLPEDDDADLVLYDALGYLRPYSDLPSGWKVIRGEEAGRAQFLAQIDLLLLDPFERRLLAAPGWVWSALQCDVPVVTPRAVADGFGEMVGSYLPGTGRDLLTLYAVDDGKRQEQCARAARESESLVEFPCAEPRKRAEEA